MGFQVIDGQEGQAMRQRHALPEGSANNQATNQARAAGCGDCVKCVMADPRLLQGFGHQAGKLLQMRPRRDFRHHAAKGRVFGLLAENRFGQDCAIRT